MSVLRAIAFYCAASPVVLFITLIYFKEIKKQRETVFWGSGVNILGLVFCYKRIVIT